MNPKNPELPSSEVSSRPSQRRWSFEDKRRLVLEAESAQRGELGALLRREGLYASQLNAWRDAYRLHGDDGLKPRKMGRPQLTDEQKEQRLENKELRRQLQLLQSKLEHAEKVIEVQKKLCDLLHLTVPSIPNE